VNALDLVKLYPLMERTSGRAEIVIALIDGPVLMENTSLWSGNIRNLDTKLPVACAQAGSAACMHGTFVAGILHAKRSSPAPAICPDCTLLIRPIFPESAAGSGEMPSASPDELGEAIVQSVDAGARVLNMSVGLNRTSTEGDRNLLDALHYAAVRGAIPVAAAGNQGTVGSSAITHHPWVLPVAACDGQGRPAHETNLGNSIGRNGLSAPGVDISSLGPDGKSRSFRGTSAAVPFVTGAIALLWSEFPRVRADQIRFALTQANGKRHATVVPPLLNAWAAWQALAAMSAAA
jgi:subtilisin family serine protease